MSWNGYENNVLLRNLGGSASEVSRSEVPRFVDVAMALGADDRDDARGVATLDYDNDGDLDLAINHGPSDDGRLFTAAKLLRNDIGQRRAWLAVELVGDRSGRDAAGASVIVRAGELEMMRLRTVGSGYASQQSGRLYFGLDGASQVDELEVRWPSGERSTFHDLASRQLLRIHEDGTLETLSLPSSSDGLATDGAAVDGTASSAAEAATPLS